MLRSGAWTARYARPNASGRRYGLLVLRPQLKLGQCDIMQAMKSQRLFLFCLILFPTVGGAQGKPRASRDWPVWGGDPENTHYSKLAQINRSNVKKLAMAWTFDTSEQGGLQTSPIIVGNVLYAISPTQKIFALDAATGKPIPAFGQDGRIDLRQNLGREPEKQSIALTSPGVVYRDLIIVGGRNPETLPAPPGDVRAYDV